MTCIHCRIGQVVLSGYCGLSKTFTVCLPARHSRVFVFVEVGYGEASAIQFNSVRDRQAKPDARLACRYHLNLMARHSIGTAFDWVIIVVATAWWWSERDVRLFTQVRRISRETLIPTVQSLELSRTYDHILSLLKSRANQRVGLS